MELTDTFSYLWVQHLFLVLPCNKSCIKDTLLHVVGLWYKCCRKPVCFLWPNHDTPPHIDWMHSPLCLARICSMLAPLPAQPNEPPRLSQSRTIVKWYRVRRFGTNPKSPTASLIERKGGRNASEVCCWTWQERFT